MVNFRYHVVSLTSVFLALAIGLVLGTAALNGPVLNNLDDQVSSLRKSNGQYRDRIEELEKASESGDDFVRQVATAALAGKFQDRSIVMVDLPGADAKQREGVIDMLKAGGAQITGNIGINNDFTDPKRAEALHDLASQSVAPGVDLPNSGDGVVTASALLASVLTKSVQVSDEDRGTVVQAFLEAGFISAEGTVNGQADGAALLLGGAATDREASKRNRAMVEIASQFDRVGQYAVAAAPVAGGDGDPLVEMRTNEATAGLSTVDGVSTAEGQLAVAMAMVEQFAGGSGKYGTGEGAKARVPALA